MPPPATDDERPARSVIVDARDPEARAPLLGLPSWLRAVLAAHAAGLAPIWIDDQGRDAALDLVALRADARLAGADLRLLEPGTRPDPHALRLDGAALVDPTGVGELARGAAPPLARGLYVAPDQPRPERRRALLRSLAHASDGLVDAWLNRPLSRRLSALLVGTGVSPNAVTLASFAVAALGAAGIASGQRPLALAGALAFQLAVALDNVDGELARLTYRSSPGGARLDLALDNAAHLLLFAALAAASVAPLGPTRALVFGGLALLGGALAFALVWRLTFGRAQPVDGALGRLLARLANRDFSVLVILAAAVDRLELLLVVLAVGTNAFAVLLALAMLAERRRR